MNFKHRLQSGDICGNWTVLSQPNGGPCGNYWTCQCECGNIKNVCTKVLIKKKSKNCSKCHIKSNRYNWFGCGELSASKFSTIRKGAKERNLAFEITIEYVWKLFLEQERKCNLSKVLLDINGSASLDRIDSKKGYIVGNVQWVHKDINFMKQAYNEDYYREMCIKVSQNPKPKVRAINNIDKLDFNGMEL